MISIHLGAQVLLDIPGADGELLSYTLGPCPRGLDEWAVYLTRDQEHRYRVAVDAQGLWRCSCPDFKYRHKPSKKGGCKHCDAVRQLDLFLESLENQP